MQEETIDAIRWGLFSITYTDYPDPGLCRVLFFAW